MSNYDLDDIFGNYGDSQPSSPPQQQQPQQQYQEKKSWGGNGGGKKSWGGEKKTFSKEDWLRKQREPQPPFLPIAMYIDRNLDNGAVEALMSIADKLISKGFTILFNADKEDIVNRMLAMSERLTYPVTTFNNFKDPNGNVLESKDAWNNGASGEACRIAIPGWSNMNEKAKPFIERNARILFTGKNNMNAKYLITASADGATKEHQVTQSTGGAGSIIQLADTFKFPVININNQESKEMLKYLLS